MEFNFVKNWMSYEAKIGTTCDRTVSVLKLCEFI